MFKKKPDRIINTEKTDKIVSKVLNIFREEQLTREEVKLILRLMLEGVEIFSVVSNKISLDKLQKDMEPKPQYTG